MAQTGSRSNVRAKVDGVVREPTTLAAGRGSVRESHCDLRSERGDSLPLGEGQMLKAIKTHFTIAVVIGTTWIVVLNLILGE
mgnify:CR=1 FL=1